MLNRKPLNRKPTQGHKQWHAWVAMLAILLAGCAPAGSTTAAAPPTPRAHTASGSHTMPDGSAMSDRDMAKMKHPATPSKAAQMVCAGDVKENVAQIFGLEKTPRPTSTWVRRIFTCTYQLSGGPLVLSVYDATDPHAGRAYFDALRTRLGKTKSLDGMVGLGFPAYETDTSKAVFLKDGKTLQVDASRLPAKGGADGTMSRTDLAYAVAASVLACWSEHAS